MKRRYLLGILAFLILWLGVQLSQSSDTGSTFSAKGEGSKALAMLFEEMNFDVRRRRIPFNRYDNQTKDTTLFVVSPGTFGNEEALLEWVRSGNTLVVVDGGGSVLASLRKKLGIEREVVAGGLFEVLSASWEPSRPVSCLSSYPECHGIERLAVGAYHALISSESFEAVVRSSDAELIFHKYEGEGRIWYIPTVELIKNDFIDRDDNLRLFYQLLGNHGTIWFDEFHHGYRAPVSVEMKEKYDAALLLAWLLGIVLVIAALSRIPRFGPALPVIERPPSGTTDFTAVLGLLYRDHNAYSVLRHYFTAWKQRVARRFGISPRLSDDAFLEELQKTFRVCTYSSRRA